MGWGGASKQVWCSHSGSIREEGDLLWHSKIFTLVFSKNFVVFEKRPFKIFQKTFLLRNFLFFGKVFILASNFGVWPFETSSLLVLSQNYFWEFNLFLLKRNSMKFGIFISLKPPLALYFCPWDKTPPKPPLPLVINLNSLSQLIQTGFGFYSNYFSPSNQF